MYQRPDVKVSATTGKDVRYLHDAQALLCGNLALNALKSKDVAGPRASKLPKESIRTSSRRSVTGGSKEPPYLARMGSAPEMVR